MKRLFYLVVILQLLFLVAQAANNEITLRTADTVYLRTAPVDPRSLFMGNYMDLNYDISSIDVSRVQVVGPRSVWGHGDTAYVGLRPAKPFARLVAVSFGSPSDTPRGLVWLRGTVIGSWAHNLRIEYGLERYYIPEGKEEEVARLPWGRAGRRQIIVEAAVRNDGTGLIRKVLVDGKPLPF